MRAPCQVAKRIRLSVAFADTTNLGDAMRVNHINEIIAFCLGAWATATGFGYLQMPAKDPTARQNRQAPIRTMLKWIGPSLILISVGLAVTKSAGAGGAA